MGELLGKSDLQPWRGCLVFNGRNVNWGGGGRAGGGAGGRGCGERGGGGEDGHVRRFWAGV